MSSKLILTLMLIVSLTSCGIVRRDPIITKETKYVYIPSTLINKCAITQPPLSTTAYLKLDYSSRESVLTAYINDLLSDLGTCNKKIGLIGEWSSKQRSINN